MAVQQKNLTLRREQKGTMSLNKLLVCPYDEAHKVKATRMQHHITRCKMNHLNEIKFTCPFNATHVLPYEEKDYHLLHCTDKAPLDRILAASLDKNNPFKGRTTVPSYSEALPSKSDETWEVEEEYGQIPGYLPAKEQPSGAFLQPAPFQGASVRKQFYHELHHQSEDINIKSYLNLGSSTQTPIPRQPKQPSQVFKFEDFPCLGIGRGKTLPSKIVANINFLPATTNNNASIKSYSSVVGDTSMHDMNTKISQLNLAVGIGDIVPDEIPPFGFGRGTIANLLPRGAEVHSFKY